MKILNLSASMTAGTLICHRQLFVVWLPYLSSDFKGPTRRQCCLEFVLLLVQDHV